MNTFTPYDIHKFKLHCFNSSVLQSIKDKCFEIAPYKYSYSEMAFLLTVKYNLSI